MRAFSFVIAVVGLVLSGCKPEAPVSTAVDISQDTMATARMTAAGEPDTTSGSDGHDFTYLTHQLWHYSGSAGADLSPDAFSGEWIDFDPKGSFTAGKGKAETYGGTWRYNEELKLLGIRPSTPDVKPSEWTIMYNDQMMVWVGTKAFGNQSTQVRLVRHAERPE